MKPLLVWAVLVSLLALPRAFAGTEYPPAALTPAQQAYLQTLIGQARAQRLWEQRLWHLLLHYRPNPFSAGYTSQADGPGFFLASGGRTHPQAELEAALAGFFSWASLPPGDMTAQCTFPARYHWLAQQLAIDPARLESQPCPRFELWRSRIDAESVSLIFSSYYFNNPSSMFGHTLLRYNKRGRGDTAHLLDFAMNYAAAVPEDDNGVIFAVRGLFGGYQGYFSMMPYYLKVKEYNDVESRDLWEYRLNLSPEQIETMLRHSWELGSTYFDYYFFDENCSYHLLSVLEAGDPRLHLTDHFRLYTLPTDTVRVVAETPGLVQSVVYRPSRSSQMEQKLSVLDTEEKGLVYTLVERPQAANNGDFQTRPPLHRALVMDAAIDYLQFEIAADPKGEQVRKGILRRLLLRRSKLRDVGPYPSFTPRSTPPHLGHRTSRMGLSGGAARPEGVDDNQGFLELSIQPAFHDLMSKEVGFAPNSQINLLHLRARYETEPQAWRLERFALADIVSIFPLTPLIKQPSWHVALGWQRNRDIGCSQCTPFFLHGGIGLSLESHLARREVYFAFWNAALEFDGAFRHGHRGGFGLGAGILVDLTGNWRVELSGSRTRYTEGDSAEVGQAALRQRYSLSQNLELRLDWSGVQGYREAMLGLGYYF